MLTASCIEPDGGKYRTSCLSGLSKTHDVLSTRKAVLFRQSYPVCTNGFGINAACFASAVWYADVLRSNLYVAFVAKQSLAVSSNKN